MQSKEQLVSTGVTGLPVVLLRGALFSPINYSLILHPPNQEKLLFSLVCKCFFLSQLPVLKVQGTCELLLFPWRVVQAKLASGLLFFGGT